MELFSRRLRALRQSQEKTQEDMSKLLHIQRSTYGEYERGKILPPVDKIKVLADYFGVSVDYIMGHTNIKTHEERNETNPEDIGVQIQIIIENLNDPQRSYTLDGRIINDECREILTSNLENCLKMAKLINK